jgi:hypothetical protein
MPARDRRDAFDVSVINTRGNLIEPVVTRRSRGAQGGCCARSRVLARYRKTISRKGSLTRARLRESYVCYVNNFRGVCQGTCMHDRVCRHRCEISLAIDRSTSATRRSRTCLDSHNSRQACRIPYTPRHPLSRSFSRPFPRARYINAPK